MIMLDYDYGFVCIVLGLMIGYYYLNIWVYVGHINYGMIVLGLT